ncbi:hypothetical protein [Rhodococcus sp. UNC363MFTsu5.1]|uniref:hypothetical protein n=1 Tax=Rhodococcus sp. UNC363MFTsu5.1 TaxID=1449069 RepID=UPI0012DFAE42|nr:hypothetical protein [Rhodococcus sp. UNC363MFTsu5.1]
MDWLGDIAWGSVEWGDVATWVASVTALVVAFVSATLSVKSLRWERLSAEAGVRSAEAAERANRLTERALSDGLRTRTATEGALNGSKVEWRVENPSANRFVLRNVGTAVADDVTVDEDSIGTIHRQLPKGAVVRPNEGVDFLLLATWGSPLPNQIYVTWRGTDEPQAVPLPV